MPFVCVHLMDHAIICHLRWSIHPFFDLLNVDEGRAFHVDTGGRFPGKNVQLYKNSAGPY